MNVEVHALYMYFISLKNTVPVAGEKPLKTKGRSGIVFLSHVNLLNNSVVRPSDFCIHFISKQY